MYLIIKLFLIFEAINLIVCQQQIDPSKANRELMLKNLQIIKDRCDKNAQVSISIERIAEQLQNLSMVGAQIGQQSQNDMKFICNNRELITTPFKTYVNFMQQCLSKEEQYAKDYLIQVVDEFLEFLCRNDGANIDILTGEQWGQCVVLLSKSADVKPEFETCMNDIIDTFSNVTTKAKFCKQLDTLESCVDGILKRHCYQYDGIRTLNGELFDALTKPCSSSTSTISLILLFVAIIISKLFV